MRFSGGQTVAFLLYLATFALVITPLIVNFKKPFVSLVAGGVFLNMLVIAVNGGMPVYDATGRYFTKAIEADPMGGIHILGTAATRLWFLGDWIPLPPPYPQPAIQSPGDLVMAVGLLLFIQWGMTQRTAEKSPKQELHPNP